MCKSNGSIVFLIASLVCGISSGRVDGEPVSQTQPTSASQPTTVPEDPQILARTTELVEELKATDPQRYVERVRGLIRMQESLVDTARPEEAPVRKAIKKAEQDWLAVALEVQRGTLKSGTPAFEQRVLGAAKTLAKAEAGLSERRIQETITSEQGFIDAVKKQASTAKGPLLDALKQQIALREERTVLLEKVMRSSEANERLRPRIERIGKLMSRSQGRMLLLISIQAEEDQITKGGDPKEIANMKKHVELDKQILEALDAVAAAEDKVEELRKQRDEVGKREDNK